jgi:hypothetical protein
MLCPKTLDKDLREFLDGGKKIFTEGIFRRERGFY